MLSFLGGTVERLKNPKNVVGWLIAGYVLVLTGYFIWGKFEHAGRIVGFFGCLAMLIPLIRLGLTRIIYGIVIGVLLVGYYGWYCGAVSITDATRTFSYEHEPWRNRTRTRKRPQYSDSGLTQTVTEFAFAPAFMFDSTVRFWKWRTHETSDGPVFRQDFGTD